MKYWGGLTVIAISVVAAALCEVLSWLLIYKTATYKQLTSSISKTSKKVETLRASGSTSSLPGSGGAAGGGDGGANKSRNKKIDKIKSRMKDANQSLSMIKFQSSAVVALTLVLVFTLLNSLFDGTVVAKLPFTPYPFFQKMTHRNIPGDDATDCSMVFLYMLCSLSIRPNLQKWLGFTPPRGSAPTSAEAVAAANQFFGITPEK